MVSNNPNEFFDSASMMWGNSSTRNEKRDCCHGPQRPQSGSQPTRIFLAFFQKCQSKCDTSETNPHVPKTNGRSLY